MLSKPWCGWCSVEINGKKIGSASYLDWLPGLILDPCIRYVKAQNEVKKKYDYVGRGYGFNIEFDAEGYHFGIVEIGEDFYTYDTCGGEPPYIRLTEIESDEFFVRNLLQEAINDFEENLDEWAWWSAIDEKEAEQDKKLITEMIEEAKKCLIE